MDRQMREELARALDEQQAELEGREVDSTCVIDCVAGVDVSFVGIPLGNETLLQIQIEDGSLVRRSELRDALLRAAAASVDRVMDQIDYVMSRANREEEGYDDGEEYS